MEDSKKKLVIASVCSLILVAMVVALVVDHSVAKDEEEPDISASQKAIKTVCDTTDYKQTCVDGLTGSGTNSSDPRELVKVAFQVSVQHIREAIRNSSTIKQLQENEKGRVALQICEELSNDAINDLERSYSKFDELDIGNMEDFLDDLKSWLSGAITHQETCLDAFRDVSTDDANKMKKLLNLSMEMSSNALAMVQELSAFIEELGSQSLKRRLLWDRKKQSDFPNWVDNRRRKLLTDSLKEIRPNLVVAKDGSGNHKTILAALEKVQKKKKKPFIIYIKEGVYKEHVKINSSMTHLMLIGDGPTKTKISGNLNFMDGTGTYHTATVAVHGDYFIARDIGFENTAGAEKHQAVALRATADRIVFFNCHFDAFQDTLYTHTYRQFYRDCSISGTIDFIFGDAAAVFQSCTILVRKPMENQQCIVTAQGRKEARQPTGIVLQNCTIKPHASYDPKGDKSKYPTFLGRPWKQFSRTIIMESYIDDFIQPKGWLPWNDTFALDTLFYSEFNNRGPGSKKSDRVKWPGIKELPAKRIKRFTVAKFIKGKKWIEKAGVPYAPSFMFELPEVEDDFEFSPVEPGENKDLGSGDKSNFVSKGDPKTKAPTTSPVSVPKTIIVTTPVGSRNQENVDSFMSSVRSFVGSPAPQPNEQSTSYSLSPSQSRSTSKSFG